MSVISAAHLTKKYTIYKKKPGFLSSVTSLFSREYEQIYAVNDVSFEIQEGELVGFIGSNGAGKTTALKCLSGLLYPSDGVVSVLEYRPCNREHAFLKQIALVMGQKNQLWWDLPGMETLLLNKEIYGVSDKKFTSVINELATILNATDFLHIPVRKLSLGQRMKMELMASLVHSPRVLFLDEPTIGLDVVMQKSLRDFIQEYNKKYTATILLTSHYMKDVEALCKRVIIINHGKILFDGLLADIIKKYAPYKIISVVLADYVDPKKIATLGDIKHFQYPQVTFTVSKPDSQKVLSRVVKLLPIEDIKIEDPEVEEIIRIVFAQQR